MDCKPEIAFTSNGDGTYTLAIGHKTYSNITFEEVITRINSEEAKDGSERQR